MRNGEPVPRPTALKIPPQVPLIPGRGRGGGSRWAEPAPWAATATQRARATAAGATGPLAHRLPRAARPIPEGRRLCGRRATKRSDWRGGRAGPSSLLPSGGPAPGVAGGRGEDLAGEARPESKRSGATKRGAGQFVKRARETDGGHVPRDGHQGPRGPRPREGPPSSSRRRSRPGCVARRMEARQGSRREAARCGARTAWPRIAGTRALRQSQPAQTQLGNWAVDRLT
jgi:translation initiation factor IF-2